MSKKNLGIAIAILVFIFAIIFVLFKFQKSKKSGSVDPEFANYISAYTSGVISSGSYIKIVLANETGEIIEYGKPIDKDLFDFSPGIKGSAFWVDARTIEFRPEKRLPSNTAYEVEFYLSEIVKNLPEHLTTFEFDIQTIEQSFEVNVDNVKTYEKHDLKWQKLIGNIETADFAETESIEKILSAEQGGNSLKLRWEHDADGKIHRYTVDSISRKETPEQVILKWDGEYVGVNNEGERIIEIPALGDFKLMDARVIQSPEQYVLMQFSDPLEETQNLDGLISLESNYDLKFIIEDNEIRAYPSSRQIGSKTLRIEQGVKNILGYKMKNEASVSLLFEEVKPAIKLVGNGVILPNSSGLNFPFEAVNLKAVDVKIIKIFEKNVLQFLQVNSLDGDRETRRVGRVILRKTVLLNSAGKIDYGRWNNFSLDLSKLIKAEPGAIYKVVLSFKKSYSTYHCDGEEEKEETLEMISETSDPADDEGSYSYYDDYDDSYDYDEDYDWNERENPCHSMYYREQSTVSRNILASDLGIIVKRGNNESMTVAITDMLTTKPMPGVKIELYNYQQIKLHEVSTNGEGMAEIKIKDKPFFLVAKKDKQRGYLKLDDGSSLSFSAFDVSGETVQKGVKGFIYTERGVWRPGDSLFVMFVLEDKDATLPKSHPVIFELINPLGQSVTKITKNTSTGGFYNFSTVTPASAPTGNYIARVRVGGINFSKTLKIETVMPNRLKLSLDFGKEKLIANDKDSKGKLTAKWLHGAIAKNLKAKVNVVLVQSSAAFKKYEKFKFEDPGATFSTEEQTIFDGAVNEQGVAVVDPKIEVKDAAPGVLKANFTVRVFEEGGNFSIDRFSMPYYPYNTYVGIKMPEPEGPWGMLYTDTSYSVKIVTLDANGKPIPGVKLKTEVYKIEWRWWWESGSENLANYASGSYHNALQKGEITTNASGQADYKFRVDYPSWGRFLVRVYDPAGGHATGQVVYLDYPGWVKRDKNNNPGGASMLVFSSDKEKYTVGEKAKLTIPSSEGGRALISIENGSKILKSYWAETKKGQTIVEIPVNEEMAPNFYASVTMIQPHAQTKNDLPIRMYGVIPIMVEDPQTHLKPVIKMPEVLVPESEVSITVSEEKGQAMSYTVAIVDEGLLDLTRFQTPDPWSAFYAREALGVKTWDMYDYVMGAYGAELQRLLSIGGDGEFGKKGGKKANRFKPMVKFIGPFELTPGQKRTHKIKMPQYVGSVKTMVIAGYKGAYGFADKVTPVRKPLMVLATLPRVLGPGEEVKLPVTIFAMEKKVKNVTVEIFPEKPLQLVGETRKTITFKEIGDEVINFDLKVVNSLGIGKVKVVARSGNEKAEFDIELDVRNPNPKVIDVVDIMLEPGKKWNNTYHLPGMKGTNKGTLEISSIPPLNLKERTRYLIEYPHGCIEQTTSGGFPQLYLGDLMTLDNITKTRITENVKAAINRIRLFQTSGGGFSYWPGDSEPNEWGTSYAGHFLLEAEAKGYKLPNNLKENWKKFQKQKALSWSSASARREYNVDLIQAYRLYTLALAKAPELGAMNRLKENGNLSVQAKWRLAAAYVLAGQPEVAKKLVSGVPKSVKSYRELSYTYGSSERDEAMILETLVLMNDRTNAAITFKKVAKELGSNAWMSTQTTAYCLLASTKFLSKTTVSKEINAAYNIDGKTLIPVRSANPVVQIDMNSKNKETGVVTIENKGQGTIFARLIMEGIPAAGDKSAVENNLKMNIIYKLANGKIINPEKLEQGTDFVAEVTVANPGMLGDYKELSLVQIFPSGWEIHNSRMDEVEGANKTAIPTYQDIRDDRVYTYFNLNEHETKTFRILLNASYLGKYYLPTIACEAMYDNSIGARKPGKWVEVIKPGE